MISASWEDNTINKIFRVRNPKLNLFLSSYILHTADKRLLLLLLIEINMFVDAYVISTMLWTPEIELVAIFSVSPVAFEKDYDTGLFFRNRLVIEIYVNLCVL